MNVLYFLFGFVIASLVWCLIIMRILDYDIEAFSETHKLFKKFSEIDMESHKSEREFLISLNDCVSEIRDENHEFKLQVLDLVEKEHELMRRYAR